MVMPNEQSKPLLYLADDHARRCRPIMSQSQPNVAREKRIADTVSAWSPTRSDASYIAGSTREAAGGWI